MASLLTTSIVENENAAVRPKAAPFVPRIAGEIVTVYVVFGLSLSPGFSVHTTAVVPSATTFPATVRITASDTTIASAGNAATSIADLNVVLMNVVSDTPVAPFDGTVESSCGG